MRAPADATASRSHITCRPSTNQEHWAGMQPLIDLANLRVRPDGRQSATATEIATGVRRLLAGYGYASVTEMTLRSGRRADILALGQDGCVWIVEIKSSVADFRADLK